MDSHKHANTSICIYMSVFMRGILISALTCTSIYERAYERDSHKHANTSTYMSLLMRGILISTLTQAYMSVLMRWILISTLIQNNL